MNEKRTNRKTPKASEPEMRPEYDFSGAVRGKYYKRYLEATNVVLLERISQQSLARIPEGTQARPNRRPNGDRPQAGGALAGTLGVTKHDRCATLAYLITCIHGV